MVSRIANTDNSDPYFSFLSRGTPMHDIRKHWSTVSTLLGLISSVYRDLNHWRSNQRLQIAVPKLYNRATSSYRTGGSVVEFRHCNLWSLVRSSVVEITVYTADET